MTMTSLSSESDINNAGSALRSSAFKLLSRHSNLQRPLGSLGLKAGHL
jgi:hypothetical protein